MRHSQKTQVAVIVSLSILIVAGLIALAMREYKTGVRKDGSPLSVNY